MYTLIVRALDGGEIHRSSHSTDGLALRYLANHAGEFGACSWVILDPAKRICRRS